jgi:hypothetical protein
MARSSLQTNIEQMVYNTKTWLNRSGDDNVQHVASEYKELVSAILNYTVRGASAMCSLTVAQEVLHLSFEECEYNSNRYLTSVDADSLRNAIVAIVNADTNVDSYSDVSIHNWRLDDQPSANYGPLSLLHIDGLEIFVHGVIYHELTYLEPSGANNIDTFLSEVNDALDTISGLEFAGINAVSTYNKSSGHVFIGVNDASYNGNKYLTSTAASTLKTLIETALDSINQLTYDNVQIIYSRNDGQPSTSYVNY